MPADGPSMPRPAARPASPGRHPRHAPVWRGAAGAVALAVWSIAGVFGAALALLPVVLERGPRGRAVTARAEDGIRRLAPPFPAVAEPRAAQPVEAARAGEAFPG